MIAVPRSRRLPGAEWILVYGALIVVAELVVGFVDVVLGAALHAVLLIAVATHSAYSRLQIQAPLAFLGLVPLLRLLSIVMLVPGLPPIVWLVLVGGPALIGAILAVRAMDMSLGEVGLGLPRSLTEQAVIGLLGLPLAWVAVNVAGLPGLAMAGVDPLLFVGVTAVFVVLLEELVFRGLLQRAAMTNGVVPGILLPNVLYAATYVSTAVPAAVAFMGLTGVVFSVVVHRTGSLWGVIGANLLMRVALQI